MKRLFRLLASTRLALVLIGCLALGCVLATLVPGALGRGYFRSAFFLVPAALFSVNLLACAAGRFARVRRAPPPRRHGPDILHLGLLAFIVAAVLSGAFRQGGVAQLAVGDRAELPGGELLTLESFSTERYPDGRPKEWTSVIRVERGGTTLVADYPLRVNHPLSVAGVTIYQASRSLRAVSGDGPEGTGALLKEGLRQEEVSGLLIVRDSFFGLVLASLALAVLGLALTFIQKLGDLSR